MPSMPLVISILSYNHPEITHRCVEKTLKDWGEIPVVLIHNGSEARWIDQHQKAFPGVKHVILSKNQGFSGGANAAMEEGFKIAPWVLFLTNDCELVQIPQPLPDSPGLYGCGMTLRKNSTFGGSFVPYRGEIKHVKNLIEWKNQKRFHSPYIPGHSFLIHCSVWQKVGGFETALGTYWEDVDYTQRALQNKIPVDILTNFKILHQGGKTTRKHSLYTLYFFQRNRWIVSWRYTPLWMKPLLMLKLGLSGARQMGVLMKSRRHSDGHLLLNAFWDAILFRKRKEQT